MNNFSERPFKIKDSPSADAQKRASNPNLNVWVAASAGTGKTKVLVDRVLRLMLPRMGEGLASAVSPDKILCITFTKAAAAEMKERITSELRRWLTLSEPELKVNLGNLCEGEVDDDMIKAARRLFARVIDLPSPMKIMTIHSFCQSILKRFPLEAAVSPHFELIDEQMVEVLLTEAMVQLDAEVVRDAALGKTHPLAEALSALKKVIPNQQALLKDILGLKNKPEAFLSLKAFDIYALHDLSPEVTIADITAEFLATDQHRAAALKAVAEMMREDSSAQQEKAKAIFDFYAALDAGPFYEAYKAVFITADNTPRKRLVTKDILEKAPEAAEVLQKEQARLFAYEEKKRALLLCQMTYHFASLALDILARYQKFKTEKALLDYDDLINKTAALLNDKDNTAWVLFKLDQGIDHILVDEAQDTNYAQWAIVKAICDDFFAGDTAAHHKYKPQNRSLFVVGDEKQSIYSFHGADVTAFDTMRHYFTQKIQNAACAFEKINLQKSFRSTASVLRAVDSVFAQPQVRQGVLSSLEDEITHHVSRVGDGGIAELWPVFESDETIDKTAVGKTDQVVKTGDFKLAEYIADQIKTWLSRGEKLLSQDRAVKPDDILILVRNRGRFAKQMIRALKARAIPMAGMDRIELQQEMIVQDMMLAVRMALYPEDDLSVARFLKTPFINFDEEKVMALCLARGTSSLYAHLASAAPAVHAIITDLSFKAKTQSPFDFLNMLLHRVFLDESLSGEGSLLRRFGVDNLEAAEELLNLSLQFETVKSPALEIFCDWFYRSKTEIKREQEGAKSAGVRIMTVHGSKGLQAPIVFLPDTLNPAKGEGQSSHIKMIVPKAGEDKAFLYAPKSALKTKLFKLYEADDLKAALDEHQRLLYVAMTRAADRLYIAGYRKKSKKKKAENGGAQENAEGATEKIREKTQEKTQQNLWYDWLYTAFKDKAEPHDFTDRAEGTKRTLYRFYNPQSKEATAKKQASKAQITYPKRPEFFQQKALAEKPHAKPLAPSHLKAEGDIFSPLDATDQTARFKRGVIAHTLLQILPDMPEHERAQMMASYLALPHHDLSPAERDDLAAEIMRLLAHPEFKMLFTQAARAEVPVTGLIKGGGQRFALSGQIDRLLVTDDKVLIVDYKTNRPPAREVQDVPLIYLRQLASYRALMAEIYPNKSIECALLWTYIPLLMRIPSERLDLALE
jgi:ATP-dependent helicase/nuclease subunit A